MKSPKLLLAILALLLLACCSACKESKPGQVSIRLKWLHQAQFAGFYYAQENGFYKERRVNVVLRPGGIDYPAIQMVASGSDQFGITGADQILLAREEGIPVVAVACIYRKTPFVLFSLKTSGITHIEQFPSRRIGVKLGGNEELTYRAMLRNSKITASQFTEIPVKFDISPLLTGQVDVWPGYSINEPIAAEEQGYQVNLIRPSDYGVTLYADVLFTTEEMVRTQPQIVRAVVGATVEGWQQAFEHPEAAIDDTLKQATGLNRSHEEKMLQASRPLIMPDSQPIGTMDVAVWKSMLTMMRTEGFLKRDVDVMAAFRTDFLPSRPSR